MSQRADTVRVTTRTMHALPLALGGMLGAGILLAPAPATAASGTWLPVAGLLAVITASCTTISITHHAFTQSGVAPSHMATRVRMGIPAARVSASAHLIGQVAVLAVLGRLVGDLLLPAMAEGAAAVCVLFVVLAATAGLRIRGWAAWLWLTLLLLTLTLIVMLGFAIAPPGGTAQAHGPGDPVGVARAAGLLCFAFFGVERCTEPGPNGQRPSRLAVPRAGIVAILVTSGVLLIFITALVHQLGHARLGLSTNPLNDVLVTAAAMDLAPLVRALIAVAMLPVLLASLEAFRTTGLALVNVGDLPSGIARRSSAGTPYLLDLLGGVLAVSLALTVGAVPGLLFASCCLLVHYALTNASARLSFQDVETSAAWSARAACLGMALCVLLFMSMSGHVLLATFAVIILGSVLIGLYTRRWS